MLFKNNGEYIFNSESGKGYAMNNAVTSEETGLKQLQKLSNTGI